MAKMRVHEIASELGLDTKVVMSRLRELGEYVKSPSSTRGACRSEGPSVFRRTTTASG